MLPSLVVFPAELGGCGARSGRMKDSKDSTRDRTEAEPLRGTPAGQDMFLRRIESDAPENRMAFALGAPGSRDWTEQAESVSWIVGCSILARSRSTVSVAFLVCDRSKRVYFNQLVVLARCPA